MKHLTELINSLENSLEKLLEKQEVLIREIVSLNLKNEELVNLTENKNQIIKKLEHKYESLKVANIIVGSKEDKHITKIKLNSLIREIDNCIIQLSE